MHPWTPVIVTIVLGVFGLAVQGFLLAYFIGRMKENQMGQAALVAAFQDFTKTAIEGLMERMKTVDELGSASTADRAALNARLMTIEKTTEGLPRLREDFAGHRAKSEAHHNRVESELQRVNMSLEGVQRQLGNLAVHGPGKVVEMGSAKS